MCSCCWAPYGRTDLFCYFLLCVVVVGLHTVGLISFVISSCVYVVFGLHTVGLIIFVISSCVYVVVGLHTVGLITVISS